MIRVLFAAPQTYSMEQLETEIRTVFPGALAVNEVELVADGEEEEKREQKRHIAVYCADGDAIDEALLADVISNHSPTLPEPSVSLEQQVIALTHKVQELESEIRELRADSEARKT